MELAAQDKVKKLMRFFEHPKAGTWERVELDIKRNRMGWGTVFLKNSDGAPLKNREIKARQLNHDFRFGCNAFKLKDFVEQEKNDAYETYFKKVFNEAVVPFYWNSTEPEPGKYRYAADSVKMDRRPPADVIVDWCEENHIAPKGHWLFCDNFVPGWLPSDSREVMRLLEKRIAGLAERYGSRIRKWDVANESFTWRPRKSPNPEVFDAEIPADYVWETFRMAEKYFPFQNEFIYNDGEDVSFRSFAYDSSPMFLLADRLIRRGARINGLGMQFHMYVYEDPITVMPHANPEVKNFFDPAHHLNVLDQLGQLNIPLHISEVSLTTYPDLPRELAEEVQAQCLRNFYRVWFSHRNCGSIVFWNLCDKTAYGPLTRGENRFDACLIGADFKEKPSYRMLDNLVNHEWHTETTIVTDENGEASWNGFYGDYELDVSGTTRIVSMNPRNSNEYRILL